MSENRKPEQGVKLRGAEKVARIPVKVVPTVETPRKPDWIRVRIPVSPEVDQIKQTLRKHKLHSVCEEASCPNLGECFSSGTATFMIMGDICTRRCPFCDVGHGRPNALDPDEPKNLAQAIADMRLKYVVITSVDRDDLRDGGALVFPGGRVEEADGKLAGGDPLAAYCLLLVAMAQMVDACPPDMQARIVKMAREAAEAMERGTGTGGRYHA